MPLLSNVTRPIRRPLGLALSGLFVAGSLLVAAPTPAAHADDDTSGISGAPAGVNGADGRSRFSYQLSPGQHLDDQYVLRNTGTTPETMKVFATDAYNTDDGAFGLLETDSVPTDAGSWVSFTGGAKTLEVPLDPGATKVIPFSVDAPADASPGDHAAGIVISVQSAQGAILVDRRVATRLYARVPGALQSSLTISSISASYSSALSPLQGSTTLTYTIRNNGNIALSAHMVAGVNTYFGIAAASPVRQDLAEMLPGSTRTVSLTVPDVGQLGYLNPYVSMAPFVDGDALDPGALTNVDRDTVTLAMPWWLIILLVIALIVYAIIRLRRRRDEKIAAAWLEYTEAEARRHAVVQ
ncbi:hypothetical protein QN358_18305 [Subtercola sp. RTI3]|nr:hypothetical protein [Subtercola sp. RTI3]